MRALKRRLEADLDGAFVEVVDRYGSMVLSVAGRIGDPATAEELTQETFLRAYRALSAGGLDLDRLELRPWLATITMNLVRNEGRRRRRKPADPLPAWGDDRLASASPALEDRVVASETEQALLALLGTLTRPQHDAVVLRHVVGLSTAETAEVMGCPPGTVRSHLSRGLAALRSALESGPEEET